MKHEQFQNFEWNKSEKAGLLLVKALDFSVTDCRRTQHNKRVAKQWPVWIVPVLCWQLG